MSQEETSKSYKKNDLIAVMKKEDKKDPVCLFQLSQNADAKSKKIKGIIFEKTETSEKNKVNFEKGKVTTISYEDILASVAPNLPGKDNTKKPADFNKYFLSKNNYSKLLNIAMENIQIQDKKEEEESKKESSIEIEEETETKAPKTRAVKKISGPKAAPLKEDEVKSEKKKENPKKEKVTLQKTDKKEDEAKKLEVLSDEGENLKPTKKVKKEDKGVKAPKQKGKPQKKDETKEKSEGNKEEGEEEEEEGKEEEEEHKEEEKSPMKKNRGRPRKSDQKEKSEEADEAEDGEPISSKKPRKKSEKRKGSEKKEKSFQKGKHNNRIDKIEDICSKLQSKSSEINDSCCIKCTNKEMIRAAYMKNHKLLKKLLESQNTISTFYERWAPDMNQNALEIIFHHEDMEALKEWISAVKSKKVHKFAVQPASTMREIQTGFNDQYAYGVRTRKVNMSRGGKEGNNALVCDLNSEMAINQISITRIFEKCTNFDMIDTLRASFPELTNQFDNQISHCVRAGNYKLAGYLIGDLFKRGGYGYNKLHEEVLTIDDPTKLSPFKKTSTMKKTLGGQIITPIHCAAINPNPEILKSLLESSKEFSVPDEKQKKPVHYAAVCEDVGPLKHLIDCGVDTREGDQMKNTPLMLACQFGRIKNVECLLENESRANVGMKNKSAYTAAHYAAEKGHTEILELLIEKKADINTPGPSRMTPLHLASAHGHFEAVELLLEKNAKILAKDKLKRNSLILAVKNGNLKIASLLLQKGITFNEGDSSKNYPLHYAAAYGFDECIDLLMKAGADPNVFNSWNLTPLTVAMQKNHFGCVKKLLSFKDTDVNCKDDQGRTLVSLSVATVNENSVEHLKFLVIDKKADLNIGDLKGWTPLHYACCLNVETVASGLVQNWYKLKENVKEKQRKKAKEIILEIVQLFIEHSQDINQISNDHKSAFSLAVSNSNYEVANLLLEHPNFEVFRISQADTCIFHDLAAVLIHKEGRNLFYKVIELMGERNKEFLNLIDHFGFTPFLQIIKNYSSSVTSYYAQIRQKLISKKLSNLPKNKKKSKSNKNEEDIEEEEGDTDGEESDVPIKPIKIMPARGMGGMAFKAPRKTLAPFGVPSPKIKEEEDGRKTLSEEDLKEIAQVALKEFFENEEDFVELLQKAVELGANADQSVDQLKKYRENPNLIEEERLQEKLKKEMLPGVAKQKTKQTARRMPGFRQNFGVNTFPGNVSNNAKKRITPYGVDGLQNSLHLVMKSPTKSLLKYILSLGIDLNQMDDEKKTPLFVFVFFNKESELFDNTKEIYQTNVEILREVLKLGMKPEVKDLDGNSPILQAAIDEKFEFVKVLAEFGANLNMMNNKWEIPLKYWVNKKNVKNVELLLRLGANPNFPDNKGRTALHHAVNVANADADASFEMESLLLQFKADINSLDKNHRIPLHYAFVKIGNPFDNAMIDPVETVSSIMGVTNALKGVADKWGKTPLHYAAQRGSNISGIYLLNSKEIDIEAKDTDGNTALAVAFINKQSNFATLLIQNGANILTNHIYVPIRKKEKENEKPYNDPFYGFQPPNFNSQIDEDPNEDDESDSENQKDKKNKMDLESESSLSDTSSLDNSPINQPAAQTNFNQWGGGGMRGQRFGQFGIYNNNNQEPEEDLKEGKSYSFFSAAIKYKWQGVSYLLIQQGYNILDAIESALSEKKFQLVLTLLSKKSEKSSFQGMNLKKQNLFHLFAIYGAECTEELMQKICKEFCLRDINPNQKDDKARIPLHYSSSKSFKHLTTYLLENKSDPEAVDVQGNTPFSLILQGNKNPKEYKFLLDYLTKGVNLTKTIKIKNQDIKMTPLLYVISQGEKTIANIKWFLDHGSDINEKDSNGCTPLIYAIKQNSKKLLNFFLSQPKFEKSLQSDKNGKTPIHYVVTPLELGSFENIEILKTLAKIYDVKAKDNHGKDPMHYALNQDSGKMVSALIDLGVPKRVKEFARSGTSIITSVDWIEEEINFEEDAHKFIEKCIENDQKEKNVVLEEKVKPDENLESNAELEVLYDDVLGPYDLLMTKVDIKAGFYSEYVFYKMQILYDKNRDVYILFNRWGRIGTQGQYQQTPFSTKEEVVKEFKKIFQSKSGNEWEKKDSFKKISKKYQLIKVEKKVNPKEYLISFDYKHAAIVNSQLEINVVKTMKLFADVKMYHEAMSELNFGQETLPLTSLDKTHLLEAKQLLTEMADLIQQVQDEMKDFKKADINNILSLRESIASKSSRYYEIVPINNYKAENVPPIDNEHQLFQQFRILDSLLNFEITTKILLGAHYNFFKKNPLDYIFAALNIRMLTLKLDDPEFRLIHRYISNSHKTKNKFVKNIFAVERKGEATNFDSFKNLSNKMLLWHGSKLENFMGILAHGMKIAPPTAAVTGHAFGRGIYFGDSFEKSWSYANYDHSNKKYKFLLLCEVALGNMLELKEFQQITELDSKYQSVMGQGREGPNFKQNIFLANGTIMPVGKIIEYEKGLDNKTRNLSLNEYIVYNEKQVRIRYLIQVNSKYA